VEVFDPASTRVKTEKYIRSVILPLENRTALKSKESSVNIATGYWPAGQDSIPGKDKSFLYSSFQTGYENHPASYPIGTRGKTAEA
jgi:hypothetical protein